LELKRESIDVGSVIDIAIDNARPLFERRGQTLKVDVPRGVRAFADPTRIAQIVANLLHNATKFTPERGAIAIALEVGRVDAQVKVTDSGTGIAPGDLERVFEMFTRIAQPGINAPGLGVGLALAR